MPDNPDYINEAVVLRGEEIDTGIIGKVGLVVGIAEIGPRPRCRAVRKK